MPADAFSSFLGMVLQGTGNNNNAWGTILNGSALQTLERALAGNVGHAVTGGTLDLSGSPPPSGQTQPIDMLQIFTGILTSNQLVKVPNLSKFWVFANQTTGAFQLLVQTPSGAQINIPQGANKFVLCDGANNLIRLDKDDVGTFVQGAVVNPGTLECTGASLLKTDFPDLYAKIGTIFGSADGTHFTLPLLTDTGRYLRSRTGSLAVGTYQASLNASHSHAVTGAPSAGSLVTDSQGAHTHTINITDPGHAHSYIVGNIAGGAGASGSVVGNLSGATTGSSVTGISAVTVSAGAHTHTVTGNAGLGTLGTATSGGAEARPESLAVITCIRY